MGIQQRDPPKVSMAPPDRVKSSRGKAHALALALVALALALDWVLAKFLEDNSFGFVGLAIQICRVQGVYSLWLPYSGFPCIYTEAHYIRSK